MELINFMYQEDYIKILWLHFLFYRNFYVIFVYLNELKIHKRKTGEVLVQSRQMSSLITIIIHIFSNLLHVVLFIIILAFTRDIYY